MKGAYCSELYLGILLRTKYLSIIVLVHIFLIILLFSLVDVFVFCEFQYTSILLKFSEH